MAGLDADVELLCGGAPPESHELVSTPTTSVPAGAILRLVVRVEIRPGEGHVSQRRRDVLRSQTWADVFEALGEGCGALVGVTVHTREFGAVDVAPGDAAGESADDGPRLVVFTCAASAASAASAAAAATGNGAAAPPAVDCGGGDDAAPPQLLAPVSRERLCNQMQNSCVMAALIGGFALSSLAAPHPDESLDKWIYLLAYIAVHACTCSALTSAFLYASANLLEDGPLFAVWAAKRRHVIALPMMKFVMGCMCYMTSVILTSWRDLSRHKALQGIATAIGIMSVASVWMARFDVSRRDV